MSLFLWFLYKKLGLLSLQAPRPHRDRARLDEWERAVVTGVWSVAEDRGAQFEVAQGPLGCPGKSSHGIMLPRRWYFLALLCLPAFSACLSLRSYCSIFSDM